MPKEIKETYLPSMVTRRLEADGGVVITRWFNPLRESLEGDTL